MFSVSEQGGHHDKLQDAGENKHDTADHPNVQERDVGDFGHILSDGAKHSSECEQCRHSHANATWNDLIVRKGNNCFQKVY